MIDKWLFDLVEAEADVEEQIEKHGVEKPQAEELIV
jgi:hypothetical protein